MSSGRPLPRPDGPAKVTGTARYSADYSRDGMLHAVLVPARVPRGRVAELDCANARAAGGVAAVLTATDVPRLTPPPVPPLAHSVIPMQDDRVHYEGQPIALVAAETREQAQHAASLVRARYAQERPEVIFGGAEVVVPDGPYNLTAPDLAVGDVTAGMASAEVTVRQTYRTADRHHSPIEPSATLAWWDGDQLNVQDSAQGIFAVQAAMAAAFGLPADHVHVSCPFVGGGFGCKGFVHPHQLLAAAAARVLRRPVQLVLTRAQMFTGCGHQPATRQTVALGATRDGRLTAVEHDSVNAAARADDYAEYGTAGTRWLYATPALRVSTRVERLDRPQPNPMRAPHEGPGMFGVESAMDELAHELGMDPVELRLRNEPDVDPVTGQPFSSRPLRACLLEGAGRFRWAGRSPEPRSMTRGHDLIGWGMAVATMDTFRFPSSARVRAHADGRVVVEAGTQEIGTGQPGVMTLIAAEALGVAPETVQVRHGDSGLPEAAMTAGSSATMGVGSAVHAAATELNGKLAALRASLPGQQASPAALLEAAGLDSMEAEARWEPAESRLSIHTYGAVFAEVRVDPDLGLVRVNRCVGTYAAGRIINPLAARSQMIGGITWGLGQALLERSVFEPNLGRFLSKNLAGYVIPGNADIGEIDVHFVDDYDEHASPIGAKGIGELGAVGVAAAIANAVFHATGIRVRDLPIGIRHLL
ncbi:MAG: xanthine dehydrogenase family protein molybdopterin-binding subunit [Streptosporangiaceae bacterium]